MLGRINQGEEVEAADGAEGGDRRGGLLLRHGGSIKAGPLALQQSLPLRGGGTELAGLGVEFHSRQGKVADSIIQFNTDQCLPVILGWAS